MTSTTDAEPTRQAIAVRGRSGKMTVSGRLKTALEAMVWQGARRAEAATRAGMTDHSLRAALKKPHVKRFYLEQLEVLRDSERAKNIHALTEVRDQTDNHMARVQAVKALEQRDEVTAAALGATRAPGMTIVVVQPGTPQIAPPPRTIEHEPPLDEDPQAPAQAIDNVQGVPDFHPYTPLANLAPARPAPPPPRPRGMHRRT